MTADSTLWLLLECSRLRRRLRDEERRSTLILWWIDNREAAP